MRKVNLTSALLLLLCASIATASAQEFYKKETITAKGTLVIAGGGDLLTDGILDKIVDLGGGKKKVNILVIPSIRNHKENAAPKTMEQFKELGCKNVDVMDVAREDLDKPENLAKLNKANVIFMAAGGTQIGLYKYLYGTEFLKKMKQMYQDGAVLAGTSAGAVVMSRVMINNSETRKSDPTGKNQFVMIEPGYVGTSNGFGLLQNVIIDVAFAQRGRYNRLYSTIMDHPDMRGLGIDMATAIVVPPSGKLEVVGGNNVMVVEPAAKPIPGSFLKEFTIWMLFPGDTYQL